MKLCLKCGKIFGDGSDFKIFPYPWIVKDFVCSACNETEKNRKVRIEYHYAFRGTDPIAFRVAMSENED